MGKYILDPIEKGYPTEAVYISRHEGLAFIKETQADSLEFLQQIQREGKFTYVGRYDNEVWKSPSYFITNDSDIKLSGVNLFIRPLQTWIGWAQSMTNEKNND
tara:strand:- start:490 stop:798 length:309 start_codon:yes stop_codon:yes gene_type:complete